MDKPQAGPRKIKLLSVVHHRFSLWRAPKWLAPRLERDFPQLEVVVRDDYEAIEESIAGAEIFIGWSLRSHQFRAARRLKWVHSTAAGVHELMSPELVASDVVVTNARGVHGPVVAEHALALIFALAKRLPACFRFQAKTEWAQEQIWESLPRPREVAGATLGIVGLGNIGNELARLAAALGMRVLAVREHPGRGPGAAHEVFGGEALGEVLERSNFVVLAAPVTPRTQRLIGAAELRRMKPEAYLINVARGTLIDDAALIAALRAGQVGGAALDVFEHEPLPPDSPYWALPNVLITPHTAAVVENLWERQYALLSENLRRYLAGAPLWNLVDKQRGY